MHKKYIIIPFLIICGILLGYLLFLNSKNSQRSTEEMTNSSNTKSLKTFSIVLESQNNSGESGIALFEAIGDKTKVVINLVGYQPGAEQPAHFHEGTCDKPLLEKYHINNLIDGKSETIVNVKLEDLMKDLPLVLNVNKSLEEDALYSACGEIIPEQ